MPLNTLLFFHLLFLVPVLALCHCCKSFAMCYTGILWDNQPGIFLSYSVGGMGGFSWSPVHVWTKVPSLVMATPCSVEAWVMF